MEKLLENGGINMRVLILGGAGFIGSVLVEELVKRNYEVRVMDILHNSTLKNIQQFIDDGSVEFIHGDIRYKDAVDKAMKDVDYVFHEACTAINRSIEYPEESLNINAIGSYNVFRSAGENDVKKVIFASSASVYGHYQYLPMDENHPKNPVTPYCISKLSSEFMLKFIANMYNMDYVILRYFNVYGARQKDSSYYTNVVLKFIRRLFNNETPIIEGDGQQSMDFVHVSDIVKANILCLNDNVKNDVFNIGTNKPTTIAELANILIKLTGKNVKPKFIPRDVIAPKRIADTTKARKILGFKYSVELEDGLKEVVEAVKNEYR